MSTRLRIGHGIDVHRFADQYQADKPLVLAGVTLPVQKSLLAHSDGDLVLHALADAVLGAIAHGDIGQHFPDSDPAIAGISSGEIIRQVLAQARAAGFSLVNIDITLVAQVPKLSPHMAAMRSSLATLTGLDSAAVNLKATTTEGMGYIGREEGMACHAVVLLQGDA
ncbi:MAG: 2-C-methyl-D-erythritol 2,4-cyclodiphosphate synthase [Gammaproteobacteria bacterium]